MAFSVARRGGRTRTGIGWRTAGRAARYGRSWRTRATPAMRSSGGGRSKRRCSIRTTSRTDLHTIHPSVSRQLYVETAVVPSQVGTAQQVVVPSAGTGENQAHLRKHTWDKWDGLSELDPGAFWLGAGGGSAGPDGPPESPPCGSCGESPGVPLPQVLPWCPAFSGSGSGVSWNVSGVATCLCVENRRACISANDFRCPRLILHAYYTAPAP